MKIHRLVIWLTGYCILSPPNPITTPGVPTGMNLFTCKCHTIVTVPSFRPAISTHSGRATWRSLGLLITLLLLELPELGLDGDGRLLSLRVLHVDVEVLWDVRLGRTLSSRCLVVASSCSRSLSLAHDERWCRGVSPASSAWVRVRSFSNSGL